MAAVPKSVQAFAADTALAMDGRLERMAQTANRIANETGDERWRRLALALRGARPLTRGLLASAPKGPRQ